MLVEPTIEKLLTKVDNRYVLAMLAAKRARQLTEFAQPLIEVKSKNVVSIAAEELAADKLAFVRGEFDVFYPMLDEPEFGFKPENPESKSAGKEERGSDNDDIEETSVMDYSANHAADDSDIEEQRIRGVQYVREYLNILDTDDEDEAAMFFTEAFEEENEEPEKTAKASAKKVEKSVQDDEEAEEDDEGLLSFEMIEDEADELELSKDDVEDGEAAISELPEDDGDAE